MTEHFGKLVKDGRVARGLGQADLADLVGAYKGTISRVERGYGCKVETAIKIAREVLTPEQWAGLLVPEEERAETEARVAEAMRSLRAVGLQVEG